MPALFAYLIALGLLFGAGYGALNWLAEPPVKVAAKAKSKSKSQPSYQQAPSSSYQAPSQEIAEASPPASKSDQGSVTPTANNHDAASASKDQKIPSQAQPSPATDEPAMQPAIASPAAGNEIRSANAEMPSDDGRRKAEQAIKPSVAADPPRSQPSTVASAAALDKSSKRSHSRQAGSHIAKRKLVAMTLRTIEFPDGRRITQLIPLGSGESLPR